MIIASHLRSPSNGRNRKSNFASNFIRDLKARGRFRCQVTESGKQRDLACFRCPGGITTLKRFLFPFFLSPPLVSEQGKSTRGEISLAVTFHHPLRSEIDSSLKKYLLRSRLRANETAVYSVGRNHRVAIIDVTHLPDTLPETSPLAESPDNQYPLAMKRAPRVISAPRFVIEK